MNKTNPASATPLDTASQVSEHLSRLPGLGYWRYDIAADKLFWSDEVYTLHGLIPGIFKPSLEKFFSFVHPDDRDKTRELFQQTIENGAAFEHRFRLIGADDVTRVIKCRAAAEADPQNFAQAAALYGIFESAEQTGESQNIYQLAANGAEAAVWHWNITTDTITWAGHAYELLGVATNQDLPVKSEEFFSLVHADDQARLRDAFRNHFQNKNKFEIGLRVKRGSRGMGWFLVRARARWGKDGRATEIYGALNDINELKLTQEKLARSNRDLEQFAGIASHDLKQPLRSISGFLEILQMKYGESLDEDAHKYINHAVKSAQDMNDLINDLLEYSKLGNEKIVYGTVPAKEIVDTVLESLQPTIEGKNARIEVSSLPTIDCDQKKLFRVFYNLIENGMKYNRSGSPLVTIESTPSSHSWVFCVTDNGIGIAPEKADEIFMMFNRLHGKGEFQGSGVGLAICKKILEIHGGEIWVEPNEPSGSRFFFTLPFKASISQ